MGMIRKSLLVFITILFLVSILITNSLLTVSESLEYENVNEELSELVEDLINNETYLEQELNINSDYLNTACINNSEIKLYHNFTSEEMIISCEGIGNNSNILSERLIDKIIEGIYYQKLECDFWDCFEKQDTPFFLISKKAQDYWNSKFLLLLFISIILFIAIFLLVENKSNSFILAGIIIVISALPIYKLTSVLRLFTDKYLLEYIKIFFSLAGTVSFKIILLGIALVILGILLKFFNLGFKINNLISRISSEIKQKFKKKEKKESTSEGDLRKKFNLK